MKKACVYFHQGWTDIIICMGLIDYYKSKYDEITVIIRSDAKNLINFYIKGKKGIKVTFINTDNGRFYGGIDNTFKGGKVEYVNNVINIPYNFDIQFHGEHDVYRNDILKGYWYLPNFIKKDAKHFSEMFYTYYNIDFIHRINSFNIIRDINMENTIYDDFVSKNGKEYVIYHDDENNHTHGSHHVSTKIEFENKLDDCNYVNLNKMSSTFFDFIKVFENAKEIHLVDSIWACLYYQLDCKYGILKNKKITLYCKRGHQDMFTYPIKLKNWVFK